MQQNGPPVSVRATNRLCWECSWASSTQPRRSCHAQQSRRSPTQDEQECLFTKPNRFTHDQTIQVHTAFLRRSARLGYRANSSTTFASTCDDADDQLFERITGNSQHLLHRLLPPEREQHYSLRERSHNYQLPERTTLLKDKTSSLECCINLEIDCHNTPLTFISQCKLDSVFACHFNKILCYVMLSGKRTWCTYKQPWTSRQWKRTAMLSS